MARIIDIKADRQAAIEAASAALADGFAIAIPTETVYGLAADATNPVAITRIYETKGRPRFNPLICHMADLAMAEKHAEFDPLSRALAAAFWPGPLTLVVPANDAAVLVRATGGRGTVGVRVSSHPVARALAEVSPAGVITATSANKSGLPAQTTADGVAAVLDRVDIVIDGGDAPGGPASTIVDVSGAEPRLIREGPIAFARVLESLR